MNAERAEGATSEDALVTQENYTVDLPTRKPNKPLGVRSGVAPASGTTPAARQGGRTSGGLSYSHDPSSNSSLGLAPSGPVPDGGRGCPESGSGGARRGLRGGTGAEPLSNFSTEGTSRRSKRLKSVERALAKMSKCGEAIIDVHTRGCGARVVRRHSCDSKWCVTCFKHWCCGAVDEIKYVIERMRCPRMITFTIKSGPDLEEQISKVWKAWGKISRRVAWKKWCRGWVWCRGLTYNRETGCWHAHMHVIVDARWVPVKDLRDLWIDCTKGEANGRGVNIRIVDSPAKAAWELVKGTKGDWVRLRKQTEHDHDLWGELIVAYKSRKWYSFGGSVERPEEEEVPKRHCPGCHVPYRYAEWDREYIDWEDAKVMAQGPLWRDTYAGFSLDGPEGWKDPRLLLFVMMGRKSA